jgi:hypothetical protein
MSNWKFGVALIVTSLAVAGCGGGGGGGGSGQTQRFTSAVGDVIAQTSEDSEPQDVSALAEDADEDNEPDKVQ